ncbi:MAG: hypothetical protein ACK5IP_13105 [Paracoccus sp. (in: a-proteobacteria)]
MSEPDLSCPSARPDMPGAQVLGVVQRGTEGQALAYIGGKAPVTDDLLAAAGDVPPTLVYRFAAPCVAGKCQHFDGLRCQLAQRIVDGLQPVVDRLPACAIRRTCRWFAQEGGEACSRCPQVVTRVMDAADPLYRLAGTPEISEEPLRP